MDGQEIAATIYEGRRRNSRLFFKTLSEKGYEAACEAINRNIGCIDINARDDNNIPFSNILFYNYDMDLLKEVLLDERLNLFARNNIGETIIDLIKTDPEREEILKKCSCVRLIFTKYYITRLAAKPGEDLSLTYKHRYV